MSRQFASAGILLVALVACDQSNPPTPAAQKSGAAKPAVTSQKKIARAVDPAIEQKIQEKLTDTALSALEKKGATEKEIIAIYGNPTRSESISYSRILTYNFSESLPTANSKGGRVGFTATLNEGKMIAWRQIYGNSTK